MPATQRVRMRIPVRYEPDFDGVRKWASKWASKNLWRFPLWARDSSDGIHDLLQETYIIFDRVCRKYLDDSVTDPGHFFSLFRTAFVNCMHDEAKRQRRSSIVVPYGFDFRAGNVDPDDGGDSDTVLDVEAPPDLAFQAVEFEEYLESLPEPVQRMYWLSRRRWPEWRKPLNRRSSNATLCRFAFIDRHKVDLRALLEEEFPDFFG